MLEWFGGADGEFAATRRGLERFFDLIEPEGDCWVWRGFIYPTGYGKSQLGGEQYAHRVSFRMSHGPIPEGREIHHICEVPHCIRPDHLEAVDHPTNIQRWMDAGRNASRFVRNPPASPRPPGRCRHGHWNEQWRWKSGRWQCPECIRSARTRLDKTC